MRVAHFAQQWQQISIHEEFLSVHFAVRAAASLIETVYERVNIVHSKRARRALDASFRAEAAVNERFTYSQIRLPLPRSMIITYSVDVSIISGVRILL